MAMHRNPRKAWPSGVVAAFVTIGLCIGVVVLFDPATGLLPAERLCEMAGAEWDGDACAWNRGPLYGTAL